MAWYTRVDSQCQGTATAYLNKSRLVGFIEDSRKSTVFPSPWALLCLAHDLPKTLASRSTVTNRKLIESWPPFFLFSFFHDLHLVSVARSEKSACRDVSNSSSCVYHRYHRVTPLPAFFQYIRAMYIRSVYILSIEQLLVRLELEIYALSWRDMNHDEI